MRTKMPHATVSSARFAEAGSLGRNNARLELTGLLLANIGALLIVPWARLS